MAASVMTPNFHQSNDDDDGAFCSFQDSPPCGPSSSPEDSPVHLGFQPSRDDTSTSTFRIKPQSPPAPPRYIFPLIGDGTHLFTGLPKPDPSSRPRTPSSPSHMLFDRVLDILRDYERARRESRMNPGDEEKCDALERAVRDIDSVWYQYNVGNLSQETYKVFDLFVNIWFWDKIIDSVTVESS